MLVLVNLNHYGLIHVSGADAQTFLQGQLTCDVRELSPNHLRLGAYCNLKGRIIVLFKLFANDSGYYLQCPINLLDKAITKLKQHAMFSKVSIEDKSTEYAKVGVVGDYEEIKALLSQGDLLKTATILAVTGIEHQWEIIAPLSLIEPLWDSLSENADIKEAKYWKLLNIRAGIPEIEANTSEQFLPHYINLPALKAVSFTKGCYHGQEIIARMQYKATIKKHMIYKVGKLNNETEVVVMTEINENNINESLVIQEADI